MPLDPRIKDFLEAAGLLTQAGRVPREPMVLLAESRANDGGAKALMARASEMEPVAHVENRMIAGPAGNVPVRLYTPEGSGPFTILVYFHGGGAAGNLDTHEIMCRYLCREAGCLVLSVGFRLPPEHKFPAWLEDCYAATCWIAAHAAQFQGDATRIAVGGDSGGGNLAAAVALMSRDRGGPAMAFQLLLCPMTDFRITTSSWKDYDGYMINREELLIFRDFYLSSKEEQAHPYASPLLASDLHGLPPALIITAECDPLRDGGEQYGQRLTEIGVPVIVSRFDGMAHGTMFLKSLVPDVANRAFTEIGRALRKAFA